MSTIPADLPLPAKYDYNKSDWGYPEATYIRTPAQPWSNTHALRVVNRDFELSSQYRYQNHDYRWNQSDNLYCGWVQQKYWEGTKVPRASLSVQLVFEQIESLIPRVGSAIFGDPQWFDVEPGMNTEPDAARRVRDAIQELLHPSRPRQQLRYCIKSGIGYGNGVLMCGWEYKEVDVRRQRIHSIPVRREVFNPVTMNFIPAPTGQYQRSVEEFIERKIISRPFIKYISLRDFFIDPNCASPNPRDAIYNIHRSFMTVDDILSLSNTPGYDVPPRQDLVAMSTQKQYEQADSSHSLQESARRVYWDPVADSSYDPAAQKLEVLHYWRDDRLVIVLNRVHALYNGVNEYYQKPYYNLFYADLLDRFYAMSLSDVLEGEQLFQTGLLNGRIDELALGLHPMTVKRTGNYTPTYQLRIRPGAVAEAPDPKNDVVREWPKNLTADVHTELAASQQRAQRSTSISDLSMGVAQATNPAARTATGAAGLIQGTNARVIGLVENVEDYMIEPMLNDAIEYFKMFADPNDIIQTTNGTEIDPVEIFNANIKFYSRGSSRMQSRAAIIQLAPWIMQVMANPALMAQLQTQGQTVDFVELMQLIMDATGYRKKMSWVRQLTPQEQQRTNRPSPDQIKAQMQTERLDKLADMQLNKGEMDLLRTVLDNTMSRTTDTELQDMEGEQAMRREVVSGLMKRNQRPGGER